MLKRTELQPGKLYTLCGATNFHPIPIFQDLPLAEGADPVFALLYPLEPFVFIEYKLSDAATSEFDPWFAYRILTRSGIVGWLHIHDDDFEALEMGFKAYSKNK